MADFSSMLKGLNSLLQGSKGALQGINSELQKISSTGSTALAKVTGVVGSFGQKRLGQGTPLGLGTDGAKIAAAGTEGNILRTAISQSQFQINTARMNFMPTMTPAQAKLSVVGGVVQAVAGVAGAAYQALPDLGTVASTAAGFYGATAGTGVNRAGLERSTLGALNGRYGRGVTSPTDMAAAAAVLSQGYNMMPGGKSYMQTMGEVGGAARFLNMNNATAAQAIGSFQTGAMGANLYQYGIAQFDKNMNPRSQGAIAQDAYKYIFGKQRMSVNEMSQQLQYGTGGASMRDMFKDPATQELIAAQFKLIAQGKNPDLAKQSGAGNPLNPAQQMAASQTDLQLRAEAPMLKGFQDAANVVSKLNSAMKGLPDEVFRLKGQLQGISGSNIGGALSTLVASLVSAAKTIGEAYLAMKAWKFITGGGSALKTIANDAPNITNVASRVANGASTAAKTTSTVGKVLKVGGKAAGIAGTALAAKDVVGGILNSMDSNKVEITTGLLHDPLGLGGGTFISKQEYDATMHDPTQSGLNEFFFGDRRIPKVRGGGTPGFGAAFNASAGNNGGVGSSTSTGANYGAKDPNVWKGAGNSHKGQDYPMPVGTDVKSLSNGVVMDSNLGKDYGVHVVIDAGGGMQYIYGHLSSKRFNRGDMVTKGQIIGKSGDTGNVTGPHLHLEIRNGKNNPVDPSTIIGGKSTVGVVSGSSAVVKGAILGTGSQQNWARQFLSKLGKPVTASNMKAVTTWMAYEGGHWNNTANYNPLNTTQPASGATNMNKVGVKSYTSWDQGFQATIDTINNGRYKNILGALSQGNSANAVVQAVNKSPWGTHMPAIKGGGSVPYGASLPGSSGTVVNNHFNMPISVQSASEEEAVRMAHKIETLMRDKTSRAISGSN